jgi:hypothetical protein
MQTFSREIDSSREFILGAALKAAPPCLKGAAQRILSCLSNESTGVRSLSRAGASMSPAVYSSNLVLPRLM